MFHRSPSLLLSAQSSSRLFRHGPSRAFRLVSSPPLLVPDAPTINNGLDDCAVLLEAPLRLLALPSPTPFRAPPASGPVTESTATVSDTNTQSCASGDVGEQTKAPLPETSQSTEPASTAVRFPRWSLPPLSAPSLASLSARVPDEYYKRVAGMKQNWQNRGKDFAVNTAKNLTLLSLKVNEVTGYREVERLKLAVKEREEDLNTKRAEAKAAKHEYEHAVLTRSTSQQNVNNLLERKHSWTDNDVAEFTRLVRSDHASRHAVTTTSQDLKQSEVEVDKAFTALMQSILERYHEEQVWSDKIRSVATWANIVALAANLIVFVGAMAFVEPWKRRRLVQGLEERMTGMMNQVEDELKVLTANVASLHGVQAGVSANTSVPSQLPAQAVTNAALTGPSPLAQHDSGPSPSTSGTPIISVEPNVGEAASPTDNVSALLGTEPSQFSKSPIEQLSLDRAPESPQSRIFGWVSTQLAHVSAPTVERDLAAASVVGAIGGAVTFGLVSLIMSSFKG